MTRTDASQRLRVRVTPRARRDEIVGERDGVWLVRVIAAPVDGRANRAVCALIAKRAGVAASRVSVIRGETSRHKTVQVAGVGPRELRRALESSGDPRGDARSRG